MKRLLLFLFLFSGSLFIVKTSEARTTPADIINEEMQAYQQRVKNYSALNQKRLASFSKKIADLNKEKTNYLENLSLRQGEILDEYVRRSNIREEGGKDGITRSNDPVAVTRIEITRTHEAIAYQAARVYIFNLTSEKNIKQDSLNLIARLSADLNLVRNKTIYSQNLLEKLLEKNAN